MKNFYVKRFFYVFLIFAALFAVSCASTPEGKKGGEAEITEPSQDEKNLSGGESSLENGDNLVDESEGLTIAEEPEEEPDEEEELPEEKVEADELPEIPEIETDDEDIILPSIEEEPVVKDEGEEEGKNPSEASSETDFDPQKNTEEGIKSSENEDDSDSSEDGSFTEEGEGEDESDENSEEEDSDSSDEEEAGGEVSEDSSGEEIEEENPPIVPSRSFTIPKNQLIDITYPGKGWVFQGCIDDEGNVDVRNRYFVFGGRKLGGENTCFTLRSRSSGRFILHFYKNDALSSSYIDDYLEICVTEKVSQSQEHIKAPEYADFVPPKPVINSELALQMKKEREKKTITETEESSASSTVSEKNGQKESGANESADVKKGKSTSSKNDKDSALKTVIQTDENEEASSRTSSDSSMESTWKKEENEKENTSETLKSDSSDDNSLEEINYSPDELLSEAKKAFAAKDYENALKLVNTFLDIAVSEIDQGLFLKGQVLETKSRVQNIKEAVKMYDMLLEEYPQSSLWEDAKKRSIFLKRFYINIR